MATDTRPHPMPMIVQRDPVPTEEPDATARALLENLRALLENLRARLESQKRLLRAARSARNVLVRIRAFLDDDSGLFDYEIERALVLLTGAIEFTDKGVGSPCGQGARAGRDNPLRTPETITPG